MAFTKQELERMIQDLQDQADSLAKQGEYKLADQRLKRIKELKEQLKHIKDSIEVLKLSGFLVKDEGVSPKFKKVMEEFGKGELKSSSGEKVTDPKQAKAIAYSESKDGGPGSGIKGHTTSRSGYKMEDPKEIESAIKKVKASGYANPLYLASLERALKIAKEERGIKDSCGEKVFTKGIEDAEEQWVTVNGAHVKVEGGESKESAAKKFIKKKGGNPEPAKGAKKSPEIKYDEKEINKIKERWSGKSKPKYGSEYGDILDYLKNNSKELPDEDEYYKLSDKLINMRKAGKKDTPEYKAVEKQRNDYNKTYNKIYKVLEEKARSLSSETEQRRLEELEKIVKGNKMKDACGEKIYTKGTKDAYKFSDPKIAEAEALINLFGGIK